MNVVLPFLSFQVKVWGGGGGGAEEGSQRRRGRRRGEKIVQIIRSDGKKTVYAGKKHERTEMPCLLSICRSAIVHGPRDLVLRLKPPALLEKSRYPSKDSQLSSHSITRSAPLERFCNRGQHKSHSSGDTIPIVRGAHKTAYEEET